MNQKGFAIWSVFVFCLLFVVRTVFGIFRKQKRELLIQNKQTNNPVCCFLQVLYSQLTVDIGEGKIRGIKLQHLYWQNNKLDGLFVCALENWFTFLFWKTRVSLE